MANNVSNVNIFSDVMQSSTGSGAERGLELWHRAIDDLLYDGTEVYLEEFIRPNAESSTSIDKVYDNLYTTMSLYYVYGVYNRVLFYDFNTGSIMKEFQRLYGQETYFSSYLQSKGLNYENVMIETMIKMLLATNDNSNRATELQIPEQFCYKSARSYNALDIHQSDITLINKQLTQNVLHQFNNTSDMAISTDIEPFYQSTAGNFIVDNPELISNITRQLMYNTCCIYGIQFATSEIFNISKFKITNRSSDLHLKYALIGISDKFNYEMNELAPNEYFTYDKESQQIYDMIVLFNYDITLGSNIQYEFSEVKTNIDNYNVTPVSLSFDDVNTSSYSNIVLTPELDLDEFYGNSEKLNGWNVGPDIKTLGEISAMYLSFYNENTYYDDMPCPGPEYSPTFLVCPCSVGFTDQSTTYGGKCQYLCKTYKFKNLVIF